jgi:hypothetical protein
MQSAFIVVRVARAESDELVIQAEDFLWAWASVNTNSLGRNFQGWTTDPWRTLSCFNLRMVETATSLAANYIPVILNKTLNEGRSASLPVGGKVRLSSACAWQLKQVPPHGQQRLVIGSPWSSCAP